MDFKVLERASEAVQDYMRADEANPDLYDQFTFRADIPGNQRYYVEPYRGQWGSMIEYGEFIPFPQKIMDQCRKIECASFMGILPEINRAWVTVDNKLYLWNYCQPEDYTCYDGIAEVIVSVALTLPKTGVFIDSVKYVLVVASPLEVTLLAISCDAKGENIRIIPTAYTMPSDNVTMVRVVGSQSGRIFMGGNDGNVYELDYSNSENSWASYIGIAADSRHKCRKINHCAWHWEFVHVIPPFLRTMTAEEDSIVDMAIDNVRQICYSVTARGILNGFYLGRSASSGGTHLFISALQLLEAAKMHLSSSRNLSESSPRPESFTNSSSAGFAVSSMHPLPPTESRKAHLVVVLRNGIRIYLSLTCSSGGLFTRIPPPCDASAWSTPSDSWGAPAGIQVVNVRAPPAAAAFRASHHVSCDGNRTLLPDDTSVGGDALHGFAPSFLPSQALRVGASLYSQGVFLVGLDREQQQPDELACAFEDLVGRANLSLGLAPSFQPPSMREGVSVALDQAVNGGKIYDIKEACGQIRYGDATSLCSLFAHSSTPPNSMIKEKSHHRESANASTKSSARPASTSAWGSLFEDRIAAAPNASTPVWFGGRALGITQGSRARLNSTSTRRGGYELHNLEQLALLGEMCWQHAPSISFSLRRQFLVLTNQGLHVLQKMRPADVLYRALAHVQTSTHSKELLRGFFSSYGPLQASAMCVALACGLPCDAGTTFSLAALDPAHAGSGSVPLETMQLRAMSEMLALTQGPSFKGHPVGAGAGAAPALQDSRLVLSGTSHEFIYSAAHDALHVVCSRIIRPVWLRSLLQVNSEPGRGRSQQQLGEWWTPGLIAQVRGPLVELRRVMRGFFAAAVMSDPSQQTLTSALSDNLAEDMLTRQMLQQAQHNISAERVLQQQAKQLEEASINALYRLTSRVLHALSLLEVLLAAQDKYQVPVRWDLLEDISFRTLAVSQRAHSCAKRVIAQVLDDMRRSSCSKPGAEQEMGVLVEWLAKECFHFFSYGDRCSFEAAQLLDTALEALSTAAASAQDLSESQKNQVLTLTNRSLQLLHQASCYWRSVEHVGGDSSELWGQCARLLRLGRAGRNGAVDLCLAAARNFSDSEAVHLRSAGAAHVRRRMSSLRAGAGGGVPDAEEGSQVSLGWEENLYHGNAAATTDSDRQACLLSCYDCLVQSVLTVGRGNFYNNLGAGAAMSSMSLHSAAGSSTGSGEVESTAGSGSVERDGAVREMNHMISRALQACADPAFHEMLGDRLLSEQQDQLLIVQSPFVEAFLRKRDADLLYSYYQRHAEYSKAANWMAEIARSPEDLHIATRIDCLRRAVASAEQAAASGTTASGHIYAAEQDDFTNHENLLDLKDSLEIAEYQQMAHARLEADVSGYLDSSQEVVLTEQQRRQVQQMHRAEERCRSQLLGVTELFQDICLPYKLWEACLLLLHVSKHDGLDLILRLWRSIVYRIVPAQGRHEEAQLFLRMRRDPAKLDTDKRHQRQDVMFEDVDQWLPALQLQVVQLGKQLQGSPTLPFCEVLEELEELLATLAIVQSLERQGDQSRSAVAGAAWSRGWTVRCFLEVGIAHAALLEAFMEVLDRWAGKAPEKLLHVLSSASYVLMAWTKTAVQHTSMNVAETRQLVQAVRSGRMRHWLEKMRRHVSTLGSRKLSSADGAELLRTVGAEVREINRRVGELSFV